MSTKYTFIYCNTENFSLHIYKDYNGLDGVIVRIGETSAFYPLSVKEIREIRKQIISEECSE